MDSYDIVVKRDKVEVKRYESLQKILDVDRLDKLVRLLNDLLAMSNVYYQEACDAIYKTLFIACKEAGYYSGPWLYVDVLKAWDENCREMTCYTIKENLKD